VSPAALRTLVIDENLPKRLATELNYRGRNAASVSALGLRGSLDPELLRKLDAQLDGDWVLVTADDAMPEDHAEALRNVGGTVATINPDRDEGWDIDAWRREVVHRWAHVMHDQPTGSVRRYSLRRHTTWRRRLRRRPR
jgi:PIN like domain